MRAITCVIKPSRCILSQATILQKRQPPHKNPPAGVASGTCTCTALSRFWENHRGGVDAQHRNQRRRAHFKHDCALFWRYLHKEHGGERCGRVTLFHWPTWIQLKSLFKAVSSWFRDPWKSTLSCPCWWIPSQRKSAFIKPEDLGSREDNENE